MNPKEKMLERITDTLGDDVQSHKEFNVLKLAKVLVEMEEKIDSPTNLPKGEFRVVRGDPYLTALDDVEKRLKDTVYRRYSPTVAYDAIDYLRKKHKE